MINPLEQFERCLSDSTMQRTGLRQKNSLCQKVHLKHTHTQMHIYARTHIHTHTLIHTHTQTLAYMHAHTHTHTHGSNINMPFNTFSITVLKVVNTACDFLKGSLCAERACLSSGRIVHRGDLLSQKLCADHVGLFSPCLWGPAGCKSPR